MISSPARPNASLHRWVVYELTRRIVRGGLEPGQLLPPEPRLSEEFGVSRIVVREAMKVLSEKGLVDVRQGRGTTVTPPGRWNPLDPMVLALRGGQDFYTAQAELLEARMIFEVQLAGLAATRISPADLGALGAHLRRMDGMVDDPDAFHVADAEFHFRLVRGAKNTVVARLLEPIHGILTSGFRLTARLPDGPQKAQVMHWAIYRPLERRDPEETRRAMRTHLERAEHDLMAVGSWIEHALDDVV